MTEKDCDCRKPDCYLCVSIEATSEVRVDATDVASGFIVLDGLGPSLVSLERKGRTFRSEIRKGRMLAITFVARERAPFRIGPDTDVLGWKYIGFRPRSLRLYPVIAERILPDGRRLIRLAEPEPEPEPNQRVQQGPIIWNDLADIDNDSLSYVGILKLIGRNREVIGLWPCPKSLGPSVRAAYKRQERPLTKERLEAYANILRLIAARRYVAETLDKAQRLAEHRSERMARRLERIRAEAMRLLEAVNATDGLGEALDVAEAVSQAVVEATKKANRPVTLGVAVEELEKLPEKAFIREVSKLPTDAQYGLAVRKAARLYGFPEDQLMALLMAFSGKRIPRL